MRIVAWINAVDQPFDAALQDGERRTQLVRDVGHELAAQGVLRPEDASNATDRDSERAAHGDGERERRRDDDELVVQPRDRRRDARTRHQERGEEAAELPHERWRSVPAAVMMPVRSHASVNL